MVPAVPAVAFTHSRCSFHRSLAHTLTREGGTGGGKSAPVRRGARELAGAAARRRAGHPARRRGWQDGGFLQGVGWGGVIVRCELS
jgi:hypothetical protein